MDLESYFLAQGWADADEADLQPFLEERGLPHRRYRDDGHVLDLRNIASTFRKQLIVTLLHLFLRTQMQHHYFMRGYLLESNFLLDFLRQSRYPQDLGDARLIEAFLQYRRHLRPKIANGSTTMATLQAEYIEYIQDVRAPQDRDIWSLEAFQLPWFRYNPTLHTRKLDFRPIPCVENRKAIQAYLWQLVTHTDLTVTSIYSRFSILRRLGVYLRDVSLFSIGRAAFEDYIGHTLADASASVFNFHMTTCRLFYTFCIQQGMCKEYPIPFALYAKRTNRAMRYAGIPASVLRQLMEHIEELPEDVALIFLVLYYTGVYGYQACTLQTDCLHRINKQPYLRFRNNEAKKEVFTPIPEELASLIQQYQKKLLDEQPSTSLLFPASAGHSRTPEDVQQAIQALCRKYDIRDEDGVLYAFRFKHLRHAYGYRLVRHHVPLLMIQKLMHHRTVDMALCYRSMEEERQKDRYLAFYDLRGRKLDDLDEESRRIDDDLLWMRHVIQQALPNGYCSLPVHVGACPHANACLACASFRTTVEFLPVLRYQLVKLQHLMKLEDVHPQAQEVFLRLQHLIAVLEEEAHHAREMAK